MPSQQSRTLQLPTGCQWQFGHSIEHERDLVACQMSAQVIAQLHRRRCTFGTGDVACHGHLAVERMQPGFDDGTLYFWMRIQLG